jgi:hypothetical protein
MTRIMDTLYEDQHTFLMPHSVLLRMRNFSEKIIEKINTQILSSITFFFFANRALCLVMEKIILQPDRAWMTVLRMRIASWIHKATNTHSEYLILIRSHTSSSQQ